MYKNDAAFSYSGKDMKFVGKVASIMIKNGAKINV
jgi:hypothetical protein